MLTESRALDWDKQAGLLPVVVQDATTLRVLMVGYMDREALAATLESRRVTFYSRTRKRLWMKGEQSGNTLDLVSLEADCDNDTLLALVNPRGPTCHLGTRSCFRQAPGDFLGELGQVVAQRQQDRPEASYTTRLFDAGTRSIAQKVGEEAVETALAAVAQDEAALCNESADLLYHLLVLLRARGLSLDDVVDVLKQRHQIR
ncbi:bifunctional phosphoribosyl-AMP cyclohydrolase/phosphoribosyl-ATP diphosphatase HisIE [Marilutibacter aestuarii]|uniref:Histidine biosynthesis bifunctional protein HisIE n=1 Tax=Marilutibacter aestuarii TaxID=1706195 RepID=A0A508ABV4_9GAMM|nr:bifunctional phosphoribosyl-AMP cyclohydrolase/phosphoribosyl-ATP diphosphatase HisIE [Lysobacter aestuarii]TQD43292.1 bifunctional phosphoribosyl-AMP cyclohydrolase/phosphoribosyl-ATP diphosphatase HisIE [Lysobacter aestuarii]